MIKPNLFIVGAPKCGTTALYHYLASHPQICMSSIKETNFWCTDFPYLKKCADKDEYMALFQEAEPSAVYWGEASPAYMRSETAVPAISRFNPEARLVVVLRNPVELLPSYHSERRFHFGEEEDDFETAWRKEEQGYLYPRYHGGGPNRYRDVVDFPRQMERIWQHFPREQVHIILFEDFIRDTARSYAGLLDFLGLENDDRESFPRYNANKSWKNEHLGRFFSRPPEFLRKLAKVYKSLTGASQVPWKKNLVQRSMTNLERTPLSQEFRRELSEYYGHDIDRLGVLIGRDLSHWKAANDR